MLTTEQVKTLALASVMYGRFGDEHAYPGTPWNERIRSLALEAIGSPSGDEVVASAIASLRDEDRNVRVAALRVLHWYKERHDVRDAILGATRDPVRRVRSIAVAMLPVDHPGAVERLQGISDDPREYHRIRGNAVMRLVSPGGRSVALKAVSQLLAGTEYRRRIIFRLVSGELDDSARAILREVVRIGAKEEAVVATRALCGQRLVRSDSGPPTRESEPVDVQWMITPGARIGTRSASYFWVAG